MVEKGGRCRCRLFAWRRRFGVRVVTAGGIYCIATLCCSKRQIERIILIWRASRTCAGM